MPVIPLSPLATEEVRQRVMNTPHSGWKELTVVEETGSTNTDLLRRAVDDRDSDRLLLMAEYQHQGRGRYTRSFEAPPFSSITFSALIRVGSVAPQRWPLIPLLLGCAVYDGVRRTLPAEAASDIALKWPNDLLYQGKKLSGMLVEAGAVGLRTSQNTPADALIAGAGINVTQTPEELPVPYAISLAMGLGEKTPRREDLAVHIFQALDQRITQWRQGADSIVEDYCDRCATLGQEVDVHIPDGNVVSGMAVDIADDGCLLVKDCRTGSYVPIRAGDVKHVRGGGCYLP